MDTKLPPHSQVRSGNKKQTERYRKVSPVVSDGRHSTRQKPTSTFTEDYVHVKRKDLFSK